MAKWIDNMDSKVSPKLGNTLRKVFMWTTMILIFVGLPVICFTIGSIAVAATIPAWTAYVAFFPWFILVAVTGTLWFYFSKWTVK